MLHASKYKLDHIAFWLITILFYAFTRRHLPGIIGWSAFLTDVIFRNGLLAIICYSNIYFLFENLFKKEKSLLYVLSVAVLLFLYTAIQNVWDGWIGSLAADKALNTGIYHAYYNFSIGVFYLAFTLALVLSKRWFQQLVLLQQIQNEKLQAELQYLKAQLNPHFLFNCINTIYFQINPDNEEARASLEKFASLLRYQLYECNEERIPIEKETGYIESYVDLQRLRKNNNHSIIFEKEDSFKNYKIAPLLLLPFVENAFKHLSDYTDRDNTIFLEMKMRDDHFTFHIHNSIKPGKGTSFHQGIGLKNASRRLELLYPEKYSLELHEDENYFSVHLKISLS